jgi:hypothetical protein
VQETRTDPVRLTEGPAAEGGCWRQFGDVALLALLLIDVPLTLVLEALFLPLYAGAVPLPISAGVAAIVNILLVLGVETVRPAPAWMSAPLALWVLLFLLFTGPGPGGDVVLPADWQTLLMFLLGLFPALSVLVWRHFRRIGA